MKAQLKELSAQIDLLEAKVVSARADMRVKRAEELRQLRSKWHAVSEKMKELEKSSGGAWEEIKEPRTKSGKTSSQGWLAPVINSSEVGPGNTARHHPGTLIISVDRTSIPPFSRRGNEYSK